ncbi:sodium:calcium antiporter, partial [Halorubrum tibetense]
WLIEGGRELLAAAGFTDLFIGLTVLAIGTSLPELAASVVAAVRDEASFSVGNVVGSNIYNVLAVIGILALVAPVEVSAGVRAFEFPALIAFTVLLVGLMYRGRRLSRLDGGILVVAYAGFIYLLIP